MNPLGKQWLVTSIVPAMLALAAMVVLGQSASPPSAASPGMQSVTGTVKTVDLSGGTLDLVTGVGYALRIQRVRLPAATLKVQGAAPESAAVVLIPGSIVRVEIRTTTAGTEASTVELVRPAPRRVKP